MTPTCSTIKTDSGSIKIQVKGDASIDIALGMIKMELKKGKYGTLYWPTLYFGTEKKVFKKKAVNNWKPKPLIDEPLVSVITDSDIPWIL